jgi:hypothetical protein
VKRERLEDLGRIRVLLEKLSEHEIFNLHHGRNKDFYDWFSVKSEEDKEDFLNKVIYAISYIEEKLSECILIARGHDAITEYTFEEIQEAFKEGFIDIFQLIEVFVDNFGKDGAKRIFKDNLPLKDYKKFVKPYIDNRY